MSIRTILLNYIEIRLQTTTPARCEGYKNIQPIFKKFTGVISYDNPHNII